MPLTAILIIAAIIALALATQAGFAQAAYNVGDALLNRTKALPNGAATTVCDSIDLGHNDTGSYLAGQELLIEAPALGTSALGDTKTMTYDVIMSDASNMSNPVVLYDNVIVQTGANGAGDGAADARVRLPSNVKRYVAVRATGSASGDASGSSFTVKLLS